MQTSRRSEASPTTDWESLRPEVTDALLANITQRIVEKFWPNQIVLFGSYAYGEPNADSDLDLLVVMESNESMAQRIVRVAEVAGVRFLPMDILVFTPDEIEARLKKGDFFINGILEKGIVLYRHDAG